jgi:hypothetical protein
MKEEWHKESVAALIWSKLIPFWPTWLKVNLGYETEKEED